MLASSSSSSGSGKRREKKKNSIAVGATCSVLQYVGYAAAASVSLTAAVGVLHRDCSCKPWLTSSDPCPASSLRYLRRVARQRRGLSHERQWEHTRQMRVSQSRKAVGIHKEKPVSTACLAEEGCIRRMHQRHAQVCIRDVHELTPLRFVLHIRIAFHRRGRHHGDLVVARRAVVVGYHHRDPLGLDRSGCRGGQKAVKGDEKAVPQGSSTAVFGGGQRRREAVCRDSAVVSEHGRVASTAPLPAPKGSETHKERR